MEAEASTLPLIVINLLFAVVALGVGFVAGGWFLGSKPAPDGPGADDEKQVPPEQQMAAERAAMASSRLKDLAASMASDVGEHSELMEQVSAELKAARDDGHDLAASDVTSALSQILTANEKLQDRLAKAENQIQAQAEEIRAHEAEARTDSLTQLANRRAFDDQLQQRFAEWSRSGNPFSLVILDVDHFKKFNDVHGHQAGDEVLRHVARAIEGSVREMDVACRYGGEEFAVILPTTTTKNAFPQIERLRAAIESTKIDFEGKTLSVTASLGLAQVTDEDDSTHLLRRADEALYAAKDAGRNNGHWHNGEVSLPVVDDTPPTRTEITSEAVKTSALDSLPNRTLFAEDLRRRISESQRTGQPLSVLIVDVLGLNAIGNQYGEGVALMALDSVALFMRNMLREMDVLARLGESQFAILLPTAVEADAKTVANRTAQALAKCPLPVGEDQLQIETSMAVAELLADDTAATLLARAEESITAGAAV